MAWRNLTKKSFPNIKKKQYLVDEYIANYTKAHPHTRISTYRSKVFYIIAIDSFSRTESPDALEEVRKRLELERTRVIKQLETLATREKDEKAQQEEVMKSNQRREYISRLSESRAALTKEAFDAGFKSLLEYLLFLEIVETHMSHDNGNAPVCSFDYRDKYII